MALTMNVDSRLIERARQAAERITGKVQTFIDQHTTISTERAVVRLLGVEGKGPDEVPLANLLLEQIADGGGLERGAAYWVLNACVHHTLSPQQVAEAVANGTLNLLQVPASEPELVARAADWLSRATLTRIRQNRENRERQIRQRGERPTPWKYLIVATGNIYEDVIQAQNAARQGADVIAVIR
ncbi:MAG TPA: lysine 5,6-aminomutase subunit alpha, partial [Symbiobacteriaceae bacterium]|nr:lysine 5,6-aminomutase subunit alpha [Symbiobacteriaceae bacterium]